MVSRISDSNRMAVPTAEMAKTVSGSKPPAILMVGMTAGGIWTTTAEMFRAIGNNLLLPSPRGNISKTANSSCPMGVSNIILVLLITVQATRHRANLPILPPGGQAFPIIPPALLVRLERNPVFLTLKLRECPSASRQISWWGNLGCRLSGIASLAGKN